MSARPPSRGAAVRLLVGGLALALLGACGSVPPPDAGDPGAPTRLPGSPSYDAAREPAAAVLPLVPASATRLLVTDLDEVRAQLGVPGQDTGDRAADRATFWRRAATEAPLLDRRLAQGTGSAGLPHGVTRDDVAWRADFAGPDGAGWVLALHPGVDLAAVHGRGARVVAADRLVVHGTTDDGHLSWATDPALAHLVDQQAEATYVHRGCLPARTAVPVPAATRTQLLRRHGADDLAPLPAFAVAFGDHLATTWTGRGRPDLFERMRLGADKALGGPAGFAAAFRHGVADPTTGRIGFEVPHPAAAAAVVRREALAPGVCPAPGG